MNEFDLIRDYFTWPIKDSSVTLGVGDDAALFSLEQGYQLVTTIDTLTEGVHFSASTPAKDIAHKSLAVNLSDIAAMGAKAKYFILALALPKIDKSWLQEFSDSLKQLSGHYEVSLIGGDTTRGPLNITITMFGMVENSKAMKRSGARPGDSVYVSGTIGDAGFCFWKLSNGLIPSNQELKRLNCPIPRVELGLVLKNLASACIDVSDGLEQDLSHILKASSVGAVIEVEKIPISEALLGHIKDTSDWSIALCGGDDYELCFTIPEGNEEALKKISKSCNVNITRIGVVTESLGLQIKGFDGPRKSYQHF
jgi:thiamine-monophosphate kinase